MVGYRCGRCGKSVDVNSDRMGIKCPICGSKIFCKERATVAKKLKAA